MVEYEKCKIFVAELSRQTTEKDLNYYFTKYGKVIKCYIVKDSKTGQSNGYAFITFADAITAAQVIENGPYNLDGRVIIPKPCIPREHIKRYKEYPKIFLGGLPMNVAEKELRKCFDKFGTVLTVDILYDQIKKRPRGFGFITFKEQAAANKCADIKYIKIKGKDVDMKLAVPKDRSKIIEPNPKDNFIKPIDLFYTNNEFNKSPPRTETTVKIKPSPWDNVYSSPSTQTPNVPFHNNSEIQTKFWDMWNMPLIFQLSNLKSRKLHTRW